MQIDFFDDLDQPLMGIVSGETLTAEFVNWCNEHEIAVSGSTWLIFCPNEATKTMLLLRWGT